MQQADAAARPKTPQAVFDRVASYYDTLNSVLSLGMDRRWRREAVASLELRPGARVLDVATGTGALAAEIVRTSAGTVSVTGCDVNERMLSVARKRAATPVHRSSSSAAMRRGYPWATRASMRSLSLLRSTTCPTVTHASGRSAACFAPADASRCSS